MQCCPTHLHGFERDINSLVDAFALQAELEHTLSFFTFKRLFKAGGYSYLHQAYPGCEHSPEYTQLLYATALNRLDLFSPTAAPSSAIWLLHVDKAAAAAAGAVPAAPQVVARPQQQWSLAGVEQTALAAGAAADAAAKVAAEAARKKAAEAAAKAAADVTANAAAVPITAASGTAAVPMEAPVQQQQQQQQECHAMHHTLSTSSLLINNELLQKGGAAGAGLEQQQLQLGQSPALHSSGVLLQQHHQQQQQQPPLEVQQQQQQQQQAALLGPQHLLDPGEASQQQQQQQQQSVVADQPVLPSPPLPPPAAAADGPALLSPLDDELMRDDFFNDLLAIFDEAEGLQGDAAAEAAAVPASTTAVPQTPNAAGAAAAQEQSKQQQQQQRPVMTVPLAVKAGVVFMLHCLHDTQLNRPHAAIYTSLQQLQLLQQAAVQFAAAGASGADALGVLQLLLSRQRLLVGQFRRPVHWVPQLPAWLAPPKPRYPDLGLGLLAANRAAARAHNGARVAAVHAAANAARSLRANPRSVDPVVHREAMFHIKTALRSLANFRSLQTLCSKYAGARQAIFEPLLRIKEPQPEPVIQQQQQQQQPAPEEEQQRSRKRGASGKADSASKRSKQQERSSQNAERFQMHLQRLEQQQQREKRQQEAAAAAAAARAAGIPELFDRNFGSNLSQLAGDEAAEMLVLLDPGRTPGNVRRMLNRQQQAMEAAEAAEAAAAGRNSTAHLRGLASDMLLQHRKAGSSKVARRAGPAVSAAMLRQQQQQGWQYLQELCAAGVLQPAEVQELQEGEVDEGSVPGLGAAASVMKLQRQRRQETLVLAEQWLRSHDAMLMQTDDGDDDMP